jgi:hypothetical protein
MDNRHGVRRRRLHRRHREPGGVRGRIGAPAERAHRQHPRRSESVGTPFRDRVSRGRLGRAVGRDLRERSPVGDGDTERAADVRAERVHPPGTEPDHPAPE